MVIIMIMVILIIIVIIITEQNFAVCGAVCGWKVLSSCGLRSNIRFAVRLTTAS